MSVRALVTSLQSAVPVAGIELPELEPAGALVWIALVLFVFAVVAFAANVRKSRRLKRLGRDVPSRREPRRRPRELPAAPVFADPYAVLGLARGAPNSDVEAAYRRLTEIYEPERFEELGEETKAEAARRMQELDEALAAIREQQRKAG